MEILTLADICRNNAENRPDKVGLIAGDRSWTFAELESDSRRAAHGLAAAGVGPTDRVAFLDRNVPEYFPLLFGGAKINSVSVAVNWRLAPPEMEFIINNAEAKLLFVGDEFLDHLSKIKLETVATVVVMGDPGDTGYVTYDDWLAQYPTDEVSVPIDGEDTCYQLYTSGTTGLPKGVELTNNNFMATMNTGQAAWEFHEDAVNLVAMPLFHIAGSGWGLAGMVSGATTVMTKDVNPMEIIELIPVHELTHALLVPAVLQFILSVPGASDADFSSMEMVTYGASPITEAVLVGSMGLFKCKFAQAYGLTETTGGVVQLDPEDHDPEGGKSHLLRAAGKPWGDVELRVVDVATMQDVPSEGDVGEIWVKTKQNMKGYWRNPQATADAFVGEWFRTGDAGYLNDGYLFIHDRVKDMIVSGGENIYPAEIENALMRHPGIADAAVIGIPSEQWGESVMAVITRSDAGLTEEVAIAFCRENLAGYKCPRSITWMETIPRNPSGKILKTELRAPYWEGRERNVN